MYSEEFVKYLLKYQNGSVKTVEKEENKASTSLKLEDVKKKYATVPLIAK